MCVCALRIVLPEKMLRRIGTLFFIIIIIVLRHIPLGTLFQLQESCNSLTRFKAQLHNWINSRVHNSFETSVCMCTYPPILVCLMLFYSFHGIDYNCYTLIVSYIWYNCLFCVFSIIRCLCCVVTDTSVTFTVFVLGLFLFLLRGVPRMQKLRGPLLGAQGYQRLPLSKSAVGPNIALHPVPAFTVSAFSAHSTSFSPNLQRWNMY